MKIHNIHQIKNIGRIEYQFNNDVYFKTNNLIYGENAAGKTTIISCLKSLFNNNLNPILTRKNINSQGTPQCKVIFRNVGTTYSCDLTSGAWTKDTDFELPPCYIFDKEYIAKNLFTETVLQSHQEQLFALYLGDVAALAEKRTIVKQRKEEIEYECNQDIKNKIAIKFPGIDISKFTLTKQKELSLIDKEALDKEIGILSNSDKIDKLPNLTTIGLQFYDDGLLKPLLEKDFKDIRDDAKTRFEEHLKSYSEEIKKETIIEFIQSGLEIQKNNKRCPFCSQDYTQDVMQLIGLYESFLSKEIIEFKNKLQQESTRFNTHITDISSAAAEKNYLSENIKNFETYNFYCEITNKKQKDQNFHPLPQLHNYIEKCNALMDSIKKKIQSPHEIKWITLIDSYNDFIKERDDLKKNVSDYNTFINNSNIEISQIKTKVSSDLSMLSQKKAIYNSINLLSDSLFLKFKIKQKGINSLKKILLNIEEQISIKSKTILNSKKDKINQLLNDFDVDFRLAEIVTNSDLRKNKKQVVFALQHKDNDTVKIHLNPIDETDPSFKTFLSEGDKNVLSFAFFITDLLDKTDLSQAIIIFDDPVSSFDAERCNTFGQIIKDTLVAKTSQLIICSHDKGFLEKLYRHFPKDNELAIIEINKNPTDRRKSSLKENKTLFELDPEHKKFIEVLLKSKNQDVDPNDIKEALRKLSELYLKFKYVHYIENPNAPLGNLIKQIKDSGGLESVIEETFSNINNASKEFAHTNTGRNLIQNQAETIIYVNSILALFHL